MIIGMLAIVLGGFLYQTLRLGPLTGAAAGLVPGFAGVDSVLLATGMLALLASGLAASSVGTYSGQVIMEGFLRRRKTPHAPGTTPEPGAAALLWPEATPRRAAACLRSSLWRLNKPAPLVVFVEDALTLDLRPGWDQPWVLAERDW